MEFHTSHSWGLCVGDTGDPDFSKTNGLVPPDYNTHFLFGQVRNCHPEVRIKKLLNTSLGRQCWKDMTNYLCLFL